MDHAAGEPHGGMDMAEVLHLVVEVLGGVQHEVADALGQIQRHFVAGQLISADQGGDHDGVADALLAAAGVAGQVEAAVGQINVVGEFVHGHGLGGVTGPEGTQLSLDDQAAHAADQLAGTALSLCILGIFLHDAVQSGQDIAHLVEGCMDGVGPGVLLAEAQTVLTPGLHQVAAEGLLHIVALGGIEHLHGGIQTLVPGAHQLGIVHAAVGGLGGLLVGQQQPVGQVVLGGVDHIQDIVVDHLHAFLDIIDLEHMDLLMCHSLLSGRKNDPPAS